jgi:hypothetical protein
LNVVVNEGSEGVQVKVKENSLSMDFDKVYTITILSM